MNTFFYLIILLLFIFSTNNAQNKIQRTNVIVILADDLGWADLSCYGSTFYETPNLDKLAKNGIRFTQNYATGPVCSPTRASIMTGKYPVKTGVTDWIRGRQEGGKAKTYEKLIAQPTAYQLALQEKTISEFALDNTYKTFFAGKWHLGDEEKYWPNYHGFQINKGGWSKGSPGGKINDSTGSFFTPYKNPNLSDGPIGEYLTDRLTNECISFIEENKEHPFFMFYSLYAVHNPLQAPKKLIAKYQTKQKLLNINKDNRFIKNETWMKNETDWKTRTVQDNAVYAAMIENMDSNLGRLMDKLKQHKLDENTLIIFTSDNGGLSSAEGSPTTNAPLRLGKGWLYEGGIRVPMIMYWKGKILSSSVSELPISTADIYPTIANAINKKYKKNETIDGENILQLLQQPIKNKNRPLFWHYPHYSNQGGKPGSAIRQGDFKLIYHYEDKSVELFNIAKDISENNNVASNNTIIVNRLKKKLFDWLKQTNALSPNINPGYNAETKKELKGQDE